MSSKPRISIRRNYIKQILLLALIIALGIFLFDKLSYFIPGGLGAITLYILLRKWNFKLVEEYKWKKWLSSIVLVIGCLIALALPFYGVIEIISPKINLALKNADRIQDAVISIIIYINEKLPNANLSIENVLNSLQKGLAYLPGILSSTASILANILTALFLLYFMFISGRDMERVLIANTPLSKKSKIIVWRETKVMIIANALGIPFLAVVQGLVATIGYYIFGVPSPFIWSLLTGVATIIPLLGTMIVWVPICIYLLSIGEGGAAIGLAIYCFVAVGGIDNVIRFLFVKKFGDVHPLITVFGVILGLDVFGIMGLIFGPLLLSYFLLLIKVYKVEFYAPKKVKTPIPENLSTVEKINITKPPNVSNTPPDTPPTD